MTDSPEEEEALDRDAADYQRDKRASAAWLDIDADVLRRMLDLPENCEILGAEGYGNPTVALLVSSPDIHPSAMRVNALYAGAFGGRCAFSRWKITAKRSPDVPVSTYRQIASFSMSAPIEDVRAAGDGGTEV
jgi:hypothetical protein